MKLRPAGVFTDALLSSLNPFEVVTSLRNALQSAADEAAREKAARALEEFLEQLEEIQQNFTTVRESLAKPDQG